MNRFMQETLRGLALSALLVAGIGNVARAADDKTVQPDNSKVNKRDRQKSAVTADQQKMNAADRETTQKIRKAVMADKGLSTYAHNVKIVTRDGMVTLKGPVKSEDEKKTIEAKAAEVSGGADKVKSEISVKQ